jgi:hypothetical protein
MATHKMGVEVEELEIEGGVQVALIVKVRLVEHPFAVKVVYDVPFGVGEVAFSIHLVLRIVLVSIGCELAELDVVEFDVAEYVEKVEAPSV